MSDRLVTIATYETTDLAHVARLQLDGAGISAVVTNEIAGWMVWEAGAAVGAVNLQVFEQDAERARSILFIDRSATAPSTGKRVCSACGRPAESGFEACWSCGASFEGQVDGIIATDDVAGASETETSASTELNELDEQLEAHVGRAWRATVIGLAACPGTAHVYSEFQLMRVNDRVEELSAKSRRRFFVASVINAVVILIAGGLIILSWLKG